MGVIAGTSPTPQDYILPMSRVGRQESMRWAAPEANYDGGDWEEDGFDAIAEEEEDVQSINSNELPMEESDPRDEPVQDYRDIYEYYGDDEDTKRQSYNQQLEDEIYQRLTPGHSRTTSADSQVDPELAALYQGTDDFLNRPISIYTDDMRTKPLAVATSDSDRRIYKMLNPKGETGDNADYDESTPQLTPVCTSIPPLPPLKGSESSETERQPTEPLAKDVRNLKLGDRKTAEGTEGFHDAVNTHGVVKSRDAVDTDLQGSSKDDEQFPTEPLESAPAPPYHDDPEPTAAPPPQPTDLQKELQAVQSELDASNHDLHVADTNAKFSNPPEEKSVSAETEEKAASPELTPIHSPSLASVAFTPSDLPGDYDSNISPTPSRHGSNSSRTSFVVNPNGSRAVAAPALALTCATPEGSDGENDAREKPDWQPRWAPAVPRATEPESEEEQLGTDLHESQISLDMSDYSSIASKPQTPEVQGFVDDDAVIEEGSGSSISSNDSDDTTTGRGAVGVALPSLNSTNSPDESLRSTVGSLENDTEGPEHDDSPAPQSKSISSKITRPPVIDLKAVFALDTSAKRLRSLWDLRVKESEYTTQLSTWLESTYESAVDKSLLFPNGQPPESEGHSLPTSRQVGTAITHSGAKTKETFQKVGKGFNVMKKLMRS